MGPYGPQIGPQWALSKVQVPAYAGCMCLPQVPADAGSRFPDDYAGVGALGPIWDPFGPIRAPFYLGSIWAHLGPFFILFGAHLGPFGAHLGPIWAHFGPIGLFWQAPPRKLLQKICANICF